MRDLSEYRNFSSAVEQACQERDRKLAELWTQAEDANYEAGRRMEKRLRPLENEARALMNATRPSEKQRYQQLLKLCKAEEDRYVAEYRAICAVLDAGRALAEAEYQLVLMQTDAAHCPTVSPAGSNWCIGGAI